MRPSGLPGTIQSSAGNTFGEASGGTSRTRFFAQDGGEKALNRCDAPALQRKELERRLKERPYSLRTVGYGWVEMGDGGQKRVAWDGSKESFGQRKNFLFMEKVIFENSKERFVQKKSFWFAEKTDFSAHARPLGEEKLLLAKKSWRLQLMHDQPIKKSFFSAQQNCNFPPQAKLTCSYKFHPRKPTVSLQQNNPFSKLRSLASAQR